MIITGPDLAELRRLGTQTLEVLRQVPGAADTGIEQEEDQAQLRLRLDRQALARYGINVRDVQDVIELAIGGRTVSTFFEGERRFDITRALRAGGAHRSLGDRQHPGHHARRRPRAAVAAGRHPVANGASIIARRENHRQISVRTNIRGRDQGGFVADAQQRFARAVKLPAGYRVDWGGQFENLARARRRLAFILPVTIAVIFALLFFTFGSTTYAGLVLLNVPFSLVGGILALYLRGINLSVSAAVGFISLFGVAVMSGVLVVSEINRRRAEQRHRREGRGDSGRAGADASGADDDRRRHARHGAGGARHRHRLRRAAPARDRRRRRAAVDAGPDAVRVAGAVLAGSPLEQRSRMTELLVLFAAELVADLVRQV